MAYVSKCPGCGATFRGYSREEVAEQLEEHRQECEQLQALASENEGEEPAETD